MYSKVRNALLLHGKGTICKPFWLDGDKNICSLLLFSDFWHTCINESFMEAIFVFSLLAHKLLILFRAKSFTTPFTWKSNDARICFRPKASVSSYIKGWSTTPGSSECLYTDYVASVDKHHAKWLTLSISSVSLMGSLNSAMLATLRLCRPGISAAILATHSSSSR